MDKELAKRNGLDLLAQHSNIKVLWVCADGTAFDRKDRALEYSTRIGNHELVEVSRQELKAETEPNSQPVEKTTDEDNEPKATKKGSKKGAKTE